MEGKGTATLAKQPRWNSQPMLGIMAV